MAFKFFRTFIHIMKLHMGRMSRMATSGLIKDIEEFQPDVISIHDPLGYTMNIPMLFDYIRRSGRFPNPYFSLRLDSVRLKTFKSMPFGITFTE